MTWSTPVTENNVAYFKEETITLPSATGTEYTSVIDFLDFVLTPSHNGYIELTVTTSSVSGSDIDIVLYGSFTSTGTTKTQLLDAPVADFSTSASAVTKVGSVNLKAYPYPYYWFGHTVAANESANTISYYITAGATRPT